MSLQAAIEKLQSPLKELVSSVTNSDQGSSTIAGRSEKDQAEVTGWIEKIAGGEVPKADGLKARSVDSSGDVGDLSSVSMSHRISTRSSSRKLISSATTSQPQMLHCMVLCTLYLYAFSIYTCCFEYLKSRT